MLSKTLRALYTATKPQPHLATVHSLNFHLPAPTKCWVCCQELEDKETHLPALPAHLLTSVPTLLPLPATAQPGHNSNFPY